ncbi:PepSY-associated TM helix domain-containing protein, partial [Bacteroides uniformis]
TLYKDADTSGKIRGWIYSVHVGSWGGWATRILSFLAALIGASLPLTGYYLWIRRLVRKSGRKVNVQLKKAA